MVDDTQGLLCSWFAQFYIALGSSIYKTSPSAAATMQTPVCILLAVASEVAAPGLSCRSAALAGTNQASRLGGVLAPAIIYASDQMHSMALPFAVVGLFSILTGALLHKLPETRGMRQPETLRDLESMYGQSDTDRAAAG